MASTGNQDFNLRKSVSKAHTFSPKLGQVNFTLMPAEPQRVGSYTDMTLVRRLWGSETSPFPVWTPWGGARSSKPELCDFFARSHYCHHPGVPTYNRRWCYRHRHRSTATHSQSAVSYSTHAGTHRGRQLLLVSPAVRCAASRGRRHTRNYHSLGPNRTGCSSSVF